MGVRDRKVDTVVDLDDASRVHIVRKHPGDEPAGRDQCTAATQAEQVGGTLQAPQVERPQATDVPEIMTAIRTVAVVRRRQMPRDEGRRESSGPCTVMTNGIPLAASSAAGLSSPIVWKCTMSGRNDWKNLRR